jgi:hypothetical protein
MMTSSAATPNTEAAILARMIVADQAAITPEIAPYLLSIRLSPADETRVNDLSEKARSGSLSDAETVELDSYLHIGSLVGIVQARARRLVSQDNNQSPH